MDLSNVDVEKLIGLGAAPVLIPILVAHLKSAAAAVRHLADGSVWPLVADVLGIAWATLAWRAGVTPDEIDNALTAGMAGLALGLAGSVLRDQVVRVATSTAAGSGAVVVTTPPPSTPPPRPPAD